MKRVILFSLVISFGIYSLVEGAVYFPLGPIFVTGYIPPVAGMNQTILYWIVNDGPAAQIISEDTSNAAIGGNLVSTAGSTSSFTLNINVLNSGGSSCINNQIAAGKLKGKTPYAIYAFVDLDNNKSGIVAYSATSGIVDSVSGTDTCDRLLISECFGIGGNWGAGTSCTSGNNNPFQGSLANVMSFSRVLTPKEARAILFSSDPSQFTNIISVATTTLWAPLTGSTDTRRFLPRGLMNLVSGPLKDSKLIPIQQNALH